MRKAFHGFSWGSSRFNVETLNNQKVLLPVREENLIDFDFMEKFIAELENQQVAKLSDYLTANGFDNYEVSNEELTALRKFTEIGIDDWGTYTIGSLFAKVATIEVTIQGKRATKETDRGLCASLSYIKLSKPGIELLCS